MSSQSYLSRRNFEISTLVKIFPHFGPMCGGGTAQERTATGRRGSKHGWVVTPATVGRQPSQRDPSPADGRPTGLAATLAPRRGNGEPRRLSRFVAFFHPTILVTRRRDHFVGARQGSPQLHGQHSPQRGLGKRCYKIGCFWTRK